MMPTYELNLNLKNDATGGIVSTQTITTSNVLGKPDAITAKVRALVEQIAKLLTTAKVTDAGTKPSRFRPDILRRKRKTKPKRKMKPNRKTKRTTKRK